jgi:inward rectifier potassium channel
VERAGVRGRRTFAPYQALLGMGWGRFLLILATYYVVVNALFAAIYLASGPGALVGQGFPGHSTLFSDYFRAYFFSVETFGTVGYGNIAPAGMPANVILTIESFVGLLSAALATGLVFARFSRPNAAIVYSKHALIAPYRGMKAFMFRCANERSDQLIEVSVQIMYSRITERANGERVREFTSLPLEFDKVTFFALSWTVVHPIDESSPLIDCTPESLAEGEAEFLVLLSGSDDTFAQTVHSRTSYKANEIIWNARFRSMFIESSERGTTGMDLSRIHEYEIVPG